MNASKYVWISWQGLRFSPHVPESAFEVGVPLSLQKYERLWSRDLHILLSFAENIGWILGFIFHDYSQLSAQGASFTS